MNDMNGLRTLVAVRKPGFKGWVLFEREGNAAYLSALARQTWGAGCEIRVLAQSSGPSWSVGYFAGEKARVHGWAFDPSIHAWRAPDEAFESLQGSPARADDCKLTIKYLGYHRMELQLAAAGQIVRLEARSHPDRIPLFVWWINAVRDDKTARCAFGRSETPVFLHACPGSDARLTRLLVTDGNVGRELGSPALVRSMDIELEARVLVDTFAAFCSDLAAHPCFAFHWCSCFGGHEPEWEAVEERIEAKVEARFPHQSGLTDEQWEQREALEALLFAQAISLTDEEQAYAAKYRRMLETLTVPDGWL